MSARQDRRSDDITQGGGGCVHFCVLGQVSKGRNRTQGRGDGETAGRTSEVVEQFDLPQRSLCEDFLAEDIGDLLDGDRLGGVVL